MTPQQRAYELFKRAAEIPADERPVFIDRECSEDIELRKKVERLLAMQNEARKFLPDEASPSPLGRLPAQVADTSIDQMLGTSIGPYKLLQEIGEGGFGTVFMAAQSEPVRREVAIKIIKPGMDSREVIARFESERQALAMMDHPNIARVFDAGQTDTGRPYFVMELVKGVPITEFCDKNCLDTTERLRLFISVCHAVQHAHQKGVIHRDLKPSNILVTLDGVPFAKVIDFGVSKSISQRLTEKTLFTQMGQMIGTPQYMSPEQAEMSGLDVDTRSDIYSLGVVLYELLTGTTPFDAERLRTAGYGEMQRIIQEEDPPKPSTRISKLKHDSTIASKRGLTDARRLRSAIQGDLDWIVMKALEKRRDRRFETANGLAADLARHLNNEPVIARPLSAVYKLQKAWRRNKLVFTATLVVIGTVMIGFVVAMFGRAEATRQRDKAQRQVYILHLGNADRALLERDFQRARVELGACPERQRRWEWRFLDERMRSTVPLELPGAEKPILTKDGRLIAVGVKGSPDDNKALIWDMSSGELLEKLEHETRLINVALSPDGNLLAGGAYDGGLTIWDLKTKKKRWTFQKHNNRYDGIAFSRDGLIATANLDQTLKVFRSDGSEMFVHRFEDKVRSIDFSPDGKWIVAGLADTHFVLVNADNGKLEALVQEGGGVPVFSADSQRIATGNPKGMITLWNWDGAELVKERSWLAGNRRIKALDFGADGSCLVSSSWETVKVWDVKTETEVDSFRAEDVVSWLTAHPEKNRVALFSNVRGIRLWDFAAAEPGVTVKTHESSIQSVEFSPDGQWITAGVNGGAKRVMVLDSKSGETINVIESDSWRSAWVPSSRSLVMTPKNAKGTLVVCDAITGKQLKKFPGHGNNVQLFVSRNGEILNCLDRDFYLRRWSIQSENLENELSMDLRTGSGVSQVRSAADDQGRLVAIVFSQQYRINIFDTTTKRITHKVPLPGQGWTRGMKFTADGRRLFVGGSAHALSLHDIESGEKLKDFFGLESSLQALALSPDEKQIVSSEVNGRVIVWDVENAMPLISLVDAHHEKTDNRVVVNSIDWSSDGRRIVAGRNDGHVQIWTMK